MERRTTTPPMAIVKNEEIPKAQNSVLTLPTNHNSLPNSSPGRLATSVFSLEPPFPNSMERLPEIEIPPRFQPILEELKQTQPNLVQQRYDEFLQAEEQAGKPPVQQADQIKLCVYRCS
jgi:hypothetical protein